MNKLYFGDNLYVLRKYVAADSVDLIYLDPPFNSSSNWNTFFKTPKGEQSLAQVEAFKDAWTWDIDTETALREVEDRRPDVHAYIQQLVTFIGKSDITAYVVMMAIRLIEMHRVLKDTGSLYLHCDPTASHYLKVLLDSIFTRERFCNEIVWKRATTVKGNAGQGSKFFGPNTDSILFYTKSDDSTFNAPFVPYSPEYLKAFYKYTEPETGRVYRLISMTGPGGAAKGNPSYEVMGVTRYWRYSRQKMQKLIEQGLVVQTSPGAVPLRKQYLDIGKGVPVQSLWDDIEPLSSQSGERVGWPTQKPLALLERIIATSSNPGDLVLDPFCGCGTAVLAAQKLDREWIGIDITHVAIQTIESRLAAAFKRKTHEVRGRPEDPDGARDLAKRDKYQFQFWAVSMVGGQPRGGAEKKGRDSGVDGELFFKSSARKNGRAVISVKGGKDSGPDEVRELIGTRVTQGADAAVFICAGKVTPEMQSAADWDGVLETAFGRFPRCQIVTIEKLFERHPVEFPLVVPASAVAAEERQRTKKKQPKILKPEDIRREPQIKLPIRGGRGRGDQQELPLKEDLLIRAPAASRSKRKRREKKEAS